MRAVLPLALASFSLLSCGDSADEPTTSSRSGASIDKSGCADRTPDSCEKDARCALIEGTRFDAKRECRDEVKALGCRSKDLNCAGRTTLIDDKDRSWVVLGDVDEPACLPDGVASETVQGGPNVDDWQSCTDKLEPPCAELPVDRCASPRCFTMKATRVEISGSCTKQTEAVACVRTGMQCTKAPTLAKDPMGNNWLLPTSCRPTGWSTLSIRLNNMTWDSLPPGWDKTCP